MQNNNVPIGFTPIEEAIEAIKSDTLENPTIDIDYIVAKQVRIEPGRNFRIPKIRKLAPEERKRDVRGNVKVIEYVGDINVEIRNQYDKEILKKAINDKYYEFKHKEYNALKTRGVSTVADDAEGRNAVQPRANTPNTKEGDFIGGGNTVTTNGESLSV